MATWVGPDTINIEPMIGDRMVALVDLEGHIWWSGHTVGWATAYASNGTHVAAGFHAEHGSFLVLVSLSGDEVWRQRLTGPASWLAVDQDQHVYASTMGAIVKYSPAGEPVWRYPIASSPGPRTLWLAGRSVWAHQSKPEPHVVRISSAETADLIPLPAKSQLVHVSEDGRWLLAGQVKSDYLTHCYLLTDKGVPVWEQELEQGRCVFASSAPILAVWSGSTLDLYRLN